jgi:hypothetical protein
MASELRVDKIIPTTGAPTGGGGGVIQIKYTHIAAAGSNHYNSNSTSWNDSGKDVLITPKFATSKILVSVGVQIYSTSSGSGHAYVGIVRDDSGDLSGTGFPSGVLHHTSCLWQSGGGGQAGNVSFQFQMGIFQLWSFQHNVRIKN